MQKHYVCIAICLIFLFSCPIATAVTLTDDNEYQEKLLEHAALCSYYGTGAEVWIDMGDYHQVSCPYCDFLAYRPHFSSCDNPYVCDECGAVTPTYQHIMPEYTDCGADHLTTCSWCKYSEIEPHVIICLFPEDCARCYAPAPSLESCEIIHAQLVNGKCTACNLSDTETAQPGDVDQSGSVTVSDAITLLTEISLSLTSSNGDVTGDGVVNIQDVLRILQYCAGWDVTLAK